MSSNDVAQLIDIGEENSVFGAGTKIKLYWYQGNTLDQLANIRLESSHSDLCCEGRDNVAVFSSDGTGDGTKGNVIRALGIMDREHKGRKQTDLAHGPTTNR